jgi:hypothetical protein
LSQVTGASVRQPSRHWAAKGLAFVGYDVLGAWYLSRSDREHLVARVVLDALDVGVWSTVDETSASAALLVSQPLATEISLRRDAKAASIISAVMFGVSTLMRRRRRLLINPFDAAWVMVGPVAGWCWRWWESNEVDRLREAHAVGLAARQHSARLAGRSEVALGADSVLDVLCRTAPLLDPAGAGAALRAPLMEWKSGLGIDVRAAGSIFLGDVVTRWQQSRNGNASVATWVWPRLPEGAGTCLLDEGQSTQLTMLLDQRVSGGRVDIDILDRPEAARFSGPKTFNVNGERVRLESRPTTRRGWSIEPAPFAFLMGAFWVGSTADPFRYGARRSVVAGAALVYLAAARVTAVALRKDRAAGRRVSLRLASGLSVGFALAGSRGARSLVANPVRLPPAIAGANALALVAGIWADEADRSDKVVTVVGALATVSAAVLLARQGWSRRVMVAELIWPLVAFTALRGLPASFRSDGDEVLAQLDQSSDVAIEEAHAAGRAEALSIVRAAVDEARRLLSRNWPTLDSRLRSEAERRLSALDDELVALEANRANCGLETRGHTDAH